MTGRNVDAAVVCEIEGLVEDRGSLTKAEIDEMFGFDDDGYKALKGTLLSRKKVESGPAKVGGFVVREKRPTRRAQRLPLPIFSGSLGRT